MAEKGDCRAGDAGADDELAAKWTPKASSRVVGLVLGFAEAASAPEVGGNSAVVVATGEASCRGSALPQGAWHSSVLGAVECLGAKPGS